MAGRKNRVEERFRVSYHKDINAAQSAAGVRIMKKKLNIPLIILVSVVCIMVAVLIFYLSGQNVQQTVGLTERIQYAVNKVLPNVDLEQIPFSIRQMAHIVEYILLGLSVAVLVLLFADAYYLKMFGAIAICFIYSVSDQIHKFFVPGREFDWYDLILDAFGYITAIALVNLIYWIIRSIVISPYEDEDHPGVLKLALVVILPAVLAVGGFLGYRQSLVNAIEQEKLEQEQELARQESVRSEIEEQGPYGLLEQGVALNIMVVGGSNASGAGTNLEQKSWLLQLNEQLEETYGTQSNYINLSLEGNGIFASYVQIMTLEEQNIDLIILCPQPDDEILDYSEEYESLLRAAMTNNPHCDIIAVTDLSQQTQEMSDAVIALAGHYDIGVSVVGLESDLADSEGVLTEQGNEEYYKAIWNVIKKKVDDGEKIDASAALPSVYSDRVFDPESFRIVEKDSFEEVSDTEYLLKGIETDGVVAVSYAFVPGDNQLKYYYDGSLCGTSDMKFDYDFTQKHIFPISNEVPVESRIKLKFKTAEQADTFENLIFVGYMD